MSTRLTKQHKTPVPIHKWHKGLQLCKNEGSEAVRSACKSLLKHIKGEKYSSKFNENLIDWCIWKYTTCDFVFLSRKNTPKNRDEDELPLGDKYAAHFYSKKAWRILDNAKSKSDIRDLRFDHVWERKFLREKISTSRDSKIVFKEFVGCVVTKKEHDRLTKPSNHSKGKGWKRYEGKIIYLYRDELGDELGKFFKGRVKNGKLVDCGSIP